MLNVKRDLIGKTITGVIAVPGEDGPGDSCAPNKPAEIWMMQFSDGSYIEFVSPSARRGLKRSAKHRARPELEGSPSPQLALNVA